MNVIKPKGLKYLVFIWHNIITMCTGRILDASVSTCIDWQWLYYLVATSTCDLEFLGCGGSDCPAKINGKSSCYLPKDLQPFYCLWPHSPLVTPLSTRSFSTLPAAVRPFWLDPVHRLSPLPFGRQEQGWQLEFNIAWDSVLMTRQLRDQCNTVKIYV